MAIRPYLIALLLAPVFFASCAGRKPAEIKVAEGKDFIREARFLHQVIVAVSNQAPKGVDAAQFAKHREYMESQRQRFRTEYNDRIGPFMKSIRPQGDAKTVVYPFGGSDLAVAMACFPQADEIVTISLESAGDPRRLPLTNAVDLRNALSIVRKYLGTYYTEHDNSYDNVWGMENGILPAQLTFSLGEAAIFGMEPASLRYFRVLPNGSFHYYDDAEIAAMEKTKGVKIHGGWFNPKCSHAFLNMEVRFTRPDGRAFTHRHISANLENSFFSNSGLEKYLRGLGKVDVMTKGASYLPWRPDFSSIRDYMLGAGDFMCADATGVLPWHAEQAGSTVTVYGTFQAGYIATNDVIGKSNSLALRRYFKEHATGQVPVRFGYGDRGGAKHMIVYRPKK